MENIIRFMHDRYKQNVTIYDKSFLERTIANRMIFSSCKSQSDYLILLNKLPAEVTMLIESLTNSYSEFFRNTLTFALLKQIIYPKVFDIKGVPHAKKVRIWSAGCAAGQEAYSLAMLADEYINEHPTSSSFRIFATDVSTKQLEDAKRGVFDQKSIRNTSNGFINSYFTVKGQIYSINENLKKYIDFSFYDLLDEDTNAPPASIFGGFDIIMCSNVLFYYQPDIQKVILDKLSRALNIGGFLLTGEAEIAIVRGEKNFKQFSTPSTIFVKT